MSVTSVVAVATLLAAVASLVTAVRYWPPRRDRVTAGRIARSLKRGRLPEDEADRPAAIRMARSSAASHWTVVMLVGLALLQVLLAQDDGGVDSRLLYGVAVLLVVAAVLTTREMVRSRRVLRDVADDRS